MVGFADGTMSILDCVNLEKLLERQVFNGDQGVAQISFDPTNMLIATSTNGEVVGISLVDSKVKYTYLDLGKDQYCTV